MRIPVRSILEQVAVAGIVVLLALLVLGAWRPIRVTGWSMHPALHPGDVVVVRTSRQVNVGEVILFQAPGHGAVLHRVIGVNRTGAVRTRGDSNAIADRAALDRRDVVGPVRFVLPVGRVLARWREADCCATMTVQSNSARR